MLPTGNVDYVERNKVCALEVFVECFGKDKEIVEDLWKLERFQTS